MYMYIYLLHICVTIFKHIYKIKYLQYVRNCRKYWVQQYRYIRTHTNYKTYLCYKIRENSWIYKNNPSLNLFEPPLALPLDVRQSDSIRIFKGKLTVNSNLVCDKSRPDFYVLGERYTNIVHTKPRHNCAPNSDLFRCKIIDCPADWKILTITFLLVLNILQREMIF